MANIEVEVDETTSSSPTVNFTDGKTSATSGNTYLIQNDGHVRLLMQSGAGSNVTVVTPNSVDGNAVSDLVIPAAANKLLLSRAFPPKIYNNADGQMAVTVSAATDIQAVRV